PDCSAADAYFRTNTIVDYVWVPGNGSAPVASFDVTPDVNDPSLFHFLNTSTDPDGDGLAVQWDFGDGATATECAPPHSYANPGTYTVGLTVTDPSGLSDSLSKN